MVSKILQAASPGRDLHVSCFCLCFGFDNIGLYFMYYRVVHPHIQYRGTSSNKGFDVEISSSNTPPRELYRVILSESNDKT